MIRTFVILAAFLASAIAEQSGSVGACPYNNPGPSINYKQYIGKWYFVRGTFSPYEPGFNCANGIVTYYANNNTFGATKKSINPSTGKTYVITETFTPYKGGWFKYGYSSVKVPENMIVPVMTPDYAVEVYCSDNSDFIGTAAVIIARDQFPSDAIISEAYTSLQKFGINTSGLKVYNQNNCASSSSASK